MFSNYLPWTTIDKPPDAKDELDSCTVLRIWGLIYIVSTRVFGGLTLANLI